MKEDEIRNREVFNEYLKLSAKDAEYFFNDSNAFEKTDNCIACNSQNINPVFTKNNFSYYECSDCDTFFVNPRPPLDMLENFYSNSPSTLFWVEKFFKPVAEIRREKIFKPRADYIESILKERGIISIADIGAGFGIFIEELRKLLPENYYTAIEPSVDMAAICRKKNINVIEDVLENVSGKENKFDVLIAFELFEHLQNPESFLKNVFNLLNENGLFIFTTLNGLGFDIQTLWKNSKSISPPHHLNFFNPWSVKFLAEKIGFDVIENSTPGKLDWDIIEGGMKNENLMSNRFWEKFSKYGDENSKISLQAWISGSKFSSHMRIILKK